MSIRLRRVFLALAAAAVGLATIASVGALVPDAAGADAAPHPTAGDDVASRPADKTDDTVVDPAPAATTTSDAPTAKGPGIPARQGPEAAAAVDPDKAAGVPSRQLELELSPEELIKAWGFEDTDAWAESLIATLVAADPDAAWLADIGNDPEPAYDPWHGVRMCESHNNYATNTGNGYYGAYQFSITTWNWVASMVAPAYNGVRPDLAPPSIQDRLAQALAFEVAGGGLHHWPICGQYYG